MGEVLRKTLRATIALAFIAFLALFAQQLLGGSVFPPEFFSFGGALVLGIFIFFSMAFSFL